MFNQGYRNNIFNQNYSNSNIFAVSHPSQESFLFGCGYSIYKYNNQLQKLQQITTENIISSLYLHDLDLYVNISNQYFIKFDYDLNQEKISKKIFLIKCFQTICLSKIKKYILLIEIH